MGGPCALLRVGVNVGHNLKHPVAADASKTTYWAMVECMPHVSYDNKIINDGFKDGGVLPVPGLRPRSYNPNQDKSGKHYRTTEAIKGKRILWAGSWREDRRGQTGGHREKDCKSCEER